ncbi:MAG TPA: hydantoinase/oxoprolinase family protein [Gemmatimonadales bacterium]|nr:hydantoinase/oxoprolinase family protein [Gemmatimonadales bacterium]
MRVGVDVGGTFTDLVALDDDGGVAVMKVATTPADPSVGVFRALDALRAPVEVLVHGTTIATNALLERRGARIALVTTRGFEDLLWLRRQDRAALYDLARDHPPPLVTRSAVIGVAERVGPRGVVESLHDEEIARVVAAVGALDPPAEAIAVALLFAFRHSEHERRLAAALRVALPNMPVAASHEVLPVFREFERISTTTVEAYLRPKVAVYVGRLERSARERGVAELRVMTSSGGTLQPGAATTRATSLALSGPAGGVVGAQLVGAAVGRPDLLTLDMGGTSADASLIADGVPRPDGGGSVGGIPIALPAILIETVSAGGGSIAHLDEGGALKVGPESAGADPGPACYRRGGTRPTVTDACLALRWLDAQHPLADDVRLDPRAAERALCSLGSLAGNEPPEIAAGIVAVTTAVMARALKRVSVARGLDPRRMTLLPFGGAGPLFGCQLADALGMDAIVIPPHPGALSALGLASAAERVDLVASFHRTLDGLAGQDLAIAFAPLLEGGAVELPGGVAQRYADCRFAGQGYEITVPVTDDDPSRIRDAFLMEHRARFGHADPGQGVELVNLRVVVTRPGRAVRFGAARRILQRPGASRPTWVRGARVTAAVWALDELAPGVTLAGPAILAGRDATALVEPGWRGTVHACGAVLLERA